MPSISSDEVRVPRHVRKAVARHEAVVVLNRGRPVLALVHPDDIDLRSDRRGRSVRAVTNELRALPNPDAAFADDMDDVLRAVGRASDDPWAQS
jgi:hypothetical protein